MLLSSRDQRFPCILNFKACPIYSQPDSLFRWSEGIRGVERYSMFLSTEKRLQAQAREKDFKVSGQSLTLIKEDVDRQYRQEIFFKKRCPLGFSHSQTGLLPPSLEWSLSEALGRLIPISLWGTGWGGLLARGRSQGCNWSHVSSIYRHARSPLRPAADFGLSWEAEQFGQHTNDITMSISDCLPNYPVKSDFVNRLKSALEARDEATVRDLICTEVRHVDAVIELANDDWMKDPSAQLPPGVLLGNCDESAASPSCAQGWGGEYSGVEGQMVANDTWPAVWFLFIYIRTCCIYCIYTCT